MMINIRIISVSTLRFTPIDKVMKVMQGRVADPVFFKLGSGYGLTGSDPDSDSNSH